MGLKAFAVLYITSNSQSPTLHPSLSLEGKGFPCRFLPRNEPSVYDLRVLQSYGTNVKLRVTRLTFGTVSEVLSSGCL